MLEYFTDAELAYRRGQIQRSGRAGRQLAGPSLLQRVRDAHRSRRNPVRGASRYESDGPMTRRLENHWINAATHH
jgi:hypothetical protein